MTGVVRTFHHHDFDVETLVAAKRGRRVSVCLPARNEASTVAAIVHAVRTRLVGRRGLVDEILVVDDGSDDGTADAAAAAGARVVAAADVLPEMGPGQGKGEALWKSLYASDGDLVVWCDADVRDFQPSFVTGLLGPLLTCDDVGLVKGFYERPLEGRTGEGGRVTELVARPLIALLFPHLAAFVQPLAGECAGRRDVLERLPFVEGYGVDLALLVDVAERFGVGCLAQVDLGRRVHRNRPLRELAPQARAVLATALRRAHLPVDVVVVERPPMVEVYRKLA